MTPIPGPRHRKSKGETSWQLMKPDVNEVRIFKEPYGVEDPKETYRKFIEGK